MIKEQVQLANPSPIGEQKGSLVPGTVKNVESQEEAPFGGVLKGFETLNKSQEIFSQIR